MPEYLLGLGEFQDALKVLTEKANEAAQTAATRGALHLEAQVKQDELSRYSHTKGTKTPSPPGEPPAVVSGTLRRSITALPGLPVGFGAYEAQAGPTVIYARIQELGGVTGRNHATRLPARPYIAPALDRIVRDGSLEQVVRDTFAAVVFT